MQRRTDAAQTEPVAMPASADRRVMLLFRIERPDGPPPTG